MLSKKKNLRRLLCKQSSTQELSQQKVMANKYSCQSPISTMTLTINTQIANNNFVKNDTQDDDTPVLKTFYPDEKKTTQKNKKTHNNTESFPPNKRTLKRCNAIANYEYVQSFYD